MNNLTRNSTKKTSQHIRTIPVVEIKAVTWNKDSHGLFDYENSYYDMKKFVINGNVTLMRTNNEITSVAENEVSEEIARVNADPLITIAKDPVHGNKYTIELQSANPYRKPPTYLIVRSLKCRDGRTQRGYDLSPGDVVKLGRVEHKIIEIQASSDPSTVKTIEDYNMLPMDTLFDANNQIIEVNEEGHLCKYCLMDRVSDNELENLMLFPCKCSGSSAGVHFGCLRNWIQYKIIAKLSNNVASYQWKKLECEICLEPLPRRVQYGPNIYELITIERPASPYIIMEKVVEDRKTSAFTLIIPEEEKTINLGRGHQCDFRISDISVSRVHAHLKFENGKFTVYDNDSKFGTLILLTNNYPIRDEKAAVQIGRTVFTFVEKKAQNEDFSIE